MYVDPICHDTTMITEVLVGMFDGNKDHAFTEINILHCTPTVPPITSLLPDGPDMSRPPDSLTRKELSGIKGL
jgi:hypothetical protein